MMHKTTPWLTALLLGTASISAFAQSNATPATPAGQAAANAPCQPSTAGSLLSGARSLLSIAGSVMDTKNSLSDATYTERANDARSVSKGTNVVDNIEKLVGKPCG